MEQAEDGCYVGNPCYSIRIRTAQSFTQSHLTGSMPKAPDLYLPRCFLSSNNSSYFFHRNRTGPRSSCALGQHKAQKLKFPGRPTTSPPPARGWDPPPPQVRALGVTSGRRCAGQEGARPTQGPVPGQPRGWTPSRQPDAQDEAIGSWESELEVQHGLPNTHPRAPRPPVRKRRCHRRPQPWKPDRGSRGACVFGPS